MIYKRISTATIFITSIVILELYKNSLILTPANLFLTSFHESFHAIFAWATGGNVQSIVVNKQDGLTTTIGGIFPIISLAGYIGTAMWGAIILTFKKSKVIIAATALIPIISLAAGGSGISEFIAVIIISTLLSVIWMKIPEKVSYAMSALFAAQSWKDVSNYLVSIPHQTDSGILANYLHAPFLTVPISIFVAISSTMIWWVAIKFDLNRTSIKN